MRSSRCSRTRLGGARSAKALGKSPCRSTPGTTSLGAWSGSMNAWLHDGGTAERLGARGDRAARCGWRGRAAVVARAGVERRRACVRRCRMAVGRRGGRAEPAVGARARRHQLSDLGGLSAVRKLVRLARHGLGVMREPHAAALACFFQMLGWTCQLFAVWTAMRAFHIHKPLPAAGLVLVLMNVATIFPLWPGNVGLVQAAIAIPLSQYYNVARATGIAYGFGLQAIEASVGVGVGLLFLAREGLSFAMLRVMPDASQAEVPAESEEVQR